jgi:hypothetical protein
MEVENGGGWFRRRLWFHSYSEQGRGWFRRRWWFRSFSEQARIDTVIGPIFGGTIRRMWEFKINSFDGFTSASIIRHASKLGLITIGSIVKDIIMNRTFQLDYTRLQTSELSSVDPINGLANMFGLIHIIMDATLPSRPVNTYIVIICAALRQNLWSRRGGY